MAVAKTAGNMNLALTKFFTDRGEAFRNQNLSPSEPTTEMPSIIAITGAPLLF
jgi:hypothetical protein